MFDLNCTETGFYAQANGKLRERPYAFDSEVYHYISRLGERKRTSMIHIRRVA